MARFPIAVAIAMLALPILALAPLRASAQSSSILDRVQERAAARAQSQTESKANEQVDSTVDKTIDCMFNPIECAKKTPAATPAPAPAPGEVAPAPAADTAEWYAESQGQRLGPMPREQLASLVTGGQVTAASLVWREGLSEWTPAGQVPELGDAFKKVPPPLPPKSGPPPLPSR